MPDRREDNNAKGENEMTKLENYAINKLKNFVEEASEIGICYNGRDIEPELQTVIIKIVEDYIDEYIDESE